MKLFLYYVSHSLKNQIKKLFKTWVAIFIVICFGLGAAIGGLLNMIGEEDYTDFDSYTDEEGRTVYYYWEDDTELRFYVETDEDGNEIWYYLDGYAPWDNPSVNEDAEDSPGTEEGDDVISDELPVLTEDGLAIVELVTGAVILAVLVMMLFGADNRGAKLFLPADAQLLFSSPMTPQAVLLFRVVCTMGTYVILSIYLFIEIPILRESLELSFFGAASMVLSWGLTLIYGTLLQVLCFSFASTHPTFKKIYSYIIYGLLAVLAGSFILFTKAEGLDMFKGAGQFFNSALSRWIPIWGWIKGFTMCAIEGKALLCAVFAILCILGIILLAAAISHTKADFYEEALAKSEEIAELQAQLREKGGLFANKRDKERPDKLSRDGLKGSGASMFFHKNLYNHFRFAKLGFLSKTGITYIAAAVLTSVLYAKFGEGGSFTTTALSLAGLAFFRSLGNQLEQDTASHYFLLIPEGTFKKMFWSMLGVVTVCLLDLLPAVIIGAVISGASAAEALGWTLFIVTLSYYATAAGAFINLSLPQQAGKNIKQVVQIMFVYFGLIPDAAIIIVGMEVLLAASILGPMAAAAGVNVLLGTLFLALSPRFVDPQEKLCMAGYAEDGSEKFVDLKKAKKVFSRMGFSILFWYIVSTVVMAGAMWFIPGVMDRYLNDSSFIYILNFVPMYAIGFPLAYLIIRKAPASRPEPVALDRKSILKAIPMTFCMMIGGSLIGTALQAIFTAITGIEAIDALEDLVSDQPLYLITFFVVILGPFVEELIFRRLLFERMRPYGEKTAIVVTAMMFGLFHGNMAQAIYAFFLGLLFAYIYARTGKLRYSYFLHALINFCGSVVPLWLMSRMEGDALAWMEGEIDLELGQMSELISQGLGAFLLFTVLEYGLAIFGLVLVIMSAKRLYFEKREQQLPRGMGGSVAIGNAGMLIFIIVFSVLIILTLFGVMG